MRTQRSTHRRSLALGALGAALLLAAAPAIAADKVHLQTDWIPSGEHAMYFGGWTKAGDSGKSKASTSPSRAGTARAIP